MKLHQKVDLQSGNPLQIECRGLDGSIVCQLWIGGVGIGVYVGNKKLFEGDWEKFVKRLSDANEAP
jgi:hypothetical protein